MVSGNKISSPLKSPDPIDSGVSSALSAKISEISKLQAKHETTNAEAVAPFELLLTASTISASLYMKKCCTDEGNLKQSSLCKPIFHCQIIQPSMNISWLTKAKSLEFVLFDFAASFPKDDTLFDSILPDHSFYRNNLMKTAKGKQNAKTGLFPSALSLNIAGDQLLHIDIEIGRSLDIKVVVEALDKLVLFSKALKLEVPADMEHQTSQSDTKSHPTTPSRQLLIAGVDLKTERISLTVSKTDSSAEGSLVAGLRCVNGQMKVKNSKHSDRTEALQFKCSVDGLDVTLAREEHQFVLLSPCIFEVDCQANLINHSGIANSTR